MFLNVQTAGIELTSPSTKVSLPLKTYGSGNHLSLWTAWRSGGSITINDSGVNDGVHSFKKVFTNDIFVDTNWRANAWVASNSIPAQSPTLNVTPSASCLMTLCFTESTGLPAIFSPVGIASSGDNSIHADTGTCLANSGDIVFGFAAQNGTGTSWTDVNLTRRNVFTNTTGEPAINGDAIANGPMNGQFTLASAAPWGAGAYSLTPSGGPSSPPVLPPPSSTVVNVQSFNAWMNGNGTPKNGTGNNGDYWVDNLSGNILQNQSGVYHTVYNRSQNIYVTDPLTSSDPNNQFLEGETLILSGKHNSPVFSNNCSHERNIYFTNGWNQQDQNAKLTCIVDNIDLNAFGQGQRFVRGSQFNVTGMGDAFVTYDYIYCGGGVNANGDEGQCVWSLGMSQLNDTVKATVKSVYKSAINTITTQAIVAGAEPQTITVADTTGVKINDWLIVEPQAPLGSNQEAVRVVAFTPTSITAKFCRKHVSGVIVTGATSVGLSSVANMGQGRLLVNHSQPYVSTGTAMSSGGTGVVGSGTTWFSSQLPGSSPTNMGAISFAADNVTSAHDANFSPTNPLCDYYAITSIIDDNNLHFLHRSQIGICQYEGKALTQGAYVIKPAAIVMSLNEPDSINSSNLILSDNSFTWTVGDTVECTISPEIDFSGFIMRVHPYSTGGTFRAMADYLNVGTSKISCGVSVRGFGNVTNGTPSYGQGFFASQCETGLVIGDCAVAAIGISSTGPNQHIRWHGAGCVGLYYNPQGEKLELAMAGNGHKIGVIEQGKILAQMDPIVGNQGEFHIGGSIICHQAGSGTDEIYYQLYNKSGDFIKVIGNGPKHGFDVMYNGFWTNNLDTPVIHIGLVGSAGGFSLFDMPPCNQRSLTGSLSDGTALKNLIKIMALFGFLKDNTTP